MTIHVATPNLDDLKHHPVSGSNIDLATDLYTNDTISVPSGWTSATVRIHGGNDTVNGNNSADTIYDNRAINARPFTGPDGTTYILPGSGSSGDDTIHAGGGTDTIFAGDGTNTYDGGGDIDTVDYSRAGVGVTVDLDTGNGQGHGSGDGTDTLISIENVTGSNQDDTITGSDVANVLMGGRGDDHLLGGGGRDTLYGRRRRRYPRRRRGRRHHVRREAGRDTLEYLFSPSGVTVDLAKGTAAAAMPRATPSSASRTSGDRSTTTP